MTIQEKRNFVDVLYSAQEIIFVYKDRKYCIQGYHENGKAHMYLSQWYPETDNPISWQYSGKTMTECGDAFLDAEIFDKNCFWNIADDIEWVDD